MKGDDFENYVASLYRNLSYVVTPNINKGGQQNDIIAQKSLPGIGLTKLIVECKFREKVSVASMAS